MEECRLSEKVGPSHPGPLQVAQQCSCLTDPRHKSLLNYINSVFGLTLPKHNNVYIVV